MTPCNQQCRRHLVFMESTSVLGNARLARRRSGVDVAYGRSPSRRGDAEPSFGRNNRRRSDIEPDESYASRPADCEATPPRREPPTLANEYGSRATLTSVESPGSAVHWRSLVASRGCQCCGRDDGNDRSGTDRVLTGSENCLPSLTFRRPSTGIRCQSPFRLGPGRVGAACANVRIDDDRPMRSQRQTLAVNSAVI